MFAAVALWACGVSTGDFVVTGLMYTAAMLMSVRRGDRPKFIVMIASIYLLVGFAIEGVSFLLNNALGTPRPFGHGGGGLQIPALILAYTLMVARKRMANVKAGVKSLQT